MQEPNKEMYGWANELVSEIKTVKNWWEMGLSGLFIGFILTTFHLISHDVII